MGDFIFIIESVKGGISESGFYHFFDNATIGAFIGTLSATLISIYFGVIFARKQYREQKEIDRFELKKDKIIDKLVFVDSKVKRAFLEVKICHNRKLFFGEEKISLLKEKL